MRPKSVVAVFECGMEHVPCAQRRAVAVKARPVLTHPIRWRALCRALRRALHRIRRRISRRIQCLDGGKLDWKRYTVAVLDKEEGRAQTGGKQRGDDG